MLPLIYRKIHLRKETVIRVVVFSGMIMRLKIISNPVIHGRSWEGR
jgi:hypothetical protein